MQANSEPGSWVEVAPGSDFPIENLPYGAFSANGGSPRIGVAIGEQIFDLRAAGEAGLTAESVPPAVLEAASLDALLALGRPAWTALRRTVGSLLQSGTARLEGLRREAFLVPQRDATMHLAFTPGDYVDFYSSLEHAMNLGKIFRPSGEALMPNWRWLPVGYHGRSSTIVIDGTPIVRPSGQRKAPEEDGPTVGPSRLLDIELEVGFVTGSSNALGSRIPIAAARDHIFGLVLVNDWSARDIQAWEYQPLGPFLGKSFATSISPWVVTLDALEPYRVPGPLQAPEPPPYLRTQEAWNYDVELSIELQTLNMREAGLGAEIVSRSNFKDMYWNMAQQLAHVTVNGTATRPGDLYASGTISGADARSYGSLIELTWRGANPLRLRSGERRTFLEDGDSVTLRGHCEHAGRPRVGFGSVTGTVLPAVQ